jgi:UDP-3-O-[3-hydroxymyristoyl] glucosamine N-acyltransferase
MSDGPAWTVGQLAAACSGRLVGDAGRRITNIRPLNEAGPEDISYLADPAWARYLADTGAGAVILREEQSGVRFAQIIATDPYLAYARVAGVIAEGLYPRRGPGVTPEARVAPDARLGEACSVWPGAWIGERAVLGARCAVHPGAYVGEDCVLGDDCELFPNAVLYRGCRLGSRVRIHACAVIGNDGYGFAQRPDRSLTKIPQLGWVEIGDDVEIGPCCTVHRGALGPTRIGRGSKLDALVLVAHNVQVGQHVRLVGQTGIAGSSEIGDRVILAGQVGVPGHIKIAADVIVASKSGPTGHMKKPGVYFGMPALPLDQARRVYSTLSHLPEMRRMLKDQERRLAGLEAASSGEAPPAD